MSAAPPASLAPRDGAGTARRPASGEPKRSEARTARKARKRAQRAALLRFGRACLRWMPLPVASALGHTLGLLVWWSMPWLRRQTLRNLELALGATTTAAECRRIGRRSFALAGRGLLSWIVLHRMGPDRALARVEASIAPAVQEVLDSGSGAIVLTMHAGLFELAGVWAARHARLVAVGADAGDDPGMALLIAMRDEMGVKTLEQGSPRAILRALEAGKLVAMLADQDIRRVNGAFVPFFGRPTHTPLGPASMAVRMGVPVIVSTMRWEGLARHRLEAIEVLRPREGLSRDDATLELTVRCSAAMERAIRARPDEWLWMHDRWRTSPADRPSSPVVAGGGAS